jgi:hypothetical protein
MDRACSMHGRDRRCMEISVLECNWKKQFERPTRLWENYS